MLTLTKPALTTEVGPKASLRALIILDREGFRPPEREIESHAGCAKNELPDHHCHGPHSVCPSCGLEFCSEEYADGDTALSDLCTDCWCIFWPIHDYWEYWRPST